MTMRPPHETWVRSTADLARLWADMMGPGGFARRSIWHVFIAPGGQLEPTVVPIDDIPESPEALLVANLAAVMSGVLAERAGVTVASLLTRPGPSGITVADSQWARAVQAAFGPELSPWPMYLATRGCVQLLSAADPIAV